jgi:hypothetical protein
MKIDVRSKESVYITINEVTYYIDDSTNEQIVEVDNGESIISYVPDTYAEGGEVSEEKAREVYDSLSFDHKNTYADWLKQWGQNLNSEGWIPKDKIADFLLSDPYANYENITNMAQFDDEIQDYYVENHQEYIDKLNGDKGFSDAIKRAIISHLKIDGEDNLYWSRHFLGDDMNYTSNLGSYDAWKKHELPFRETITYAEGGEIITKNN